MTRVEVKNGNVEYALKRFKLKVQRSGVPSEMKKRKEYSKPGVVRREAKKKLLRMLEEIIENIITKEDVYNAIW